MWVKLSNNMVASSTAGRYSVPISPLVNNYFN
jgi:hypothetical protein